MVSLMLGREQALPNRSTDLVGSGRDTTAKESDELDGEFETLLVLVRYSG